MTASSVTSKILYTFTDEASISPSSIEREAGQISGGSAIVAFLEYLLHEDRRGLPRSRPVRQRCAPWRPDLAA